MAGERWPTVPFGHLVENFDSVRVPVKEGDRRSGPYPYYGASGVVDRVDGYLFDGEYLLVAEDGENLRTRQTPIAFLASGKFWVNNHAHIVRANSSNDTRFLMYAMRVAEVGAYLTGSTMPKLTQANMNRVPVVAPPLDDQRAIARMLGTLDDKIELNHRMNETLREMARTVFKSWFIDFDRHRGARIEDTGLPTGWAWTNLALLTSKIGSGSTPRGGDRAYADRGTHLIRSQNVYDENFIWDGLVCIRDEESHRMRSVTVEAGDVLLNITGASILRTCIVDPDVLPARVNQHVAIVRPLADVPSTFVHQHLLRAETKAYLMGMDAGASRQAVTKAHIESVRIPRPPQSVLREFDAITRPMLERIFSSARESRTLAELRDTLVPKLLSGAVRIRDAERAVEAVA